MDRQPKAFSERPCAYRGCQEPFQPKKKNQIYCRSSHKVAEFTLRKFDRAVKAEVRRRLKQRRKNGQPKAKLAS